MGTFDHNWISRLPTNRQPAWLGRHNLVGQLDAAWLSESDPSDSDLQLPADHPARQMGIDLSQPFVVGGRTFAPLPGTDVPAYARHQPAVGAWTK